MSQDIVKAAEPAADPLPGLYEFVRRHLLVVNNVCLASATVVGMLDFFCPTLRLLPAIIYSATLGLLALLVLAAAAPFAFARALGALGYAPRAAGGVPIHARPAWQVGVAFLSAVSLIGFVSVAKAAEGGVIAAAFPDARKLQVALLSIQADVGQIKAGVEAANVKLDDLVANSKDPQKDLVARGYPWTDGGFMQALQQGDGHAIALYAKAGFKAGGSGPLSVAMGDTFAWDPRVAATLNRAMFAARDACPRVAALWTNVGNGDARVALYKRLCDPSAAALLLEDQIKSYESSANASSAAARSQDARHKRLALLRAP